MIERGAKVNGVRNDLGQTPLIAAFSSVSPMSRDCIRYLIRYGAEVNLSTPQWELPIILAVVRRSQRILKLLDEYGADPNSCAKDGHTAFQLAVKTGHADTVRCLVRAGADINVVNEHLGPAAILAVQTNNKNLLHVLVRGGIDLGMVDDIGRTAMDYAAEGHMLKRRGFDALVRIIKSGDLPPPRRKKRTRREQRLAKRTWEPQKEHKKVKTYSVDTFI